MSLLDRFKSFADRLSGKAPRPVEPPIDPKISSAWANASSPRKPSLFDRIKEGTRSLFKTSNAPVETQKSAARPPMESQTPNPRKPSLFERLKEGTRNLFKSPGTPTDAQKSAEKAAKNIRRFQEANEPTDREQRQREIFKFRRNTSYDGNAFYRLTQSIWDVPGVSVQDRDRVIFEYYRDKYGLTDPNEIYDKVMRDNAEWIEKYRNSPTPFKYEVLKNFKVEEAAL